MHNNVHNKVKSENLAVYFMSEVYLLLLMDFVSICFSVVHICEEVDRPSLSLFLNELAEGVENSV